MWCVGEQERKDLRDMIELWLVMWNLKWLVFIQCGLSCGEILNNECWEDLRQGSDVDFNFYIKQFVYLYYIYIYFLFKIWYRF